MQRVAQDRDNVVVEARRIEAEAAAALAAPTDDIVGGDVFTNADDVFSTPESRDE